MKNKLILSVITVLLSLSNYAQMETIFAARDDASVYIKHYLDPVLNGLMYDLNNGWYSQAKTHKKFGFDLTVTASIAMIPETDKYFQFVESEYNNLSLQSGDAQLPTFAGGETNTVIESNYSDYTYEIDALDGIGDSWSEAGLFIPLAIPMAMVQAGVGVSDRTDVNLRVLPTVKNNGVSINLYGAGIKHNISKYLIKSDSLICLSVLGAYTRANVNYTPNSTDIPGDNQKVTMGINSYTLQGIVGVNLKIVNFYMGLGYVGGKTNLDVLGNYDFDFDDNGTIESDETIVDPVTIDFAVSGVRATFGTRFDLGPIKIFGDYTLQKYQSITAGIAVSIR